MLMLAISGANATKSNKKNNKNLNRLRNITSHCLICNPSVILQTAFNIMPRHCFEIYLDLLKISKVKHLYSSSDIQHPHDVLDDLILLYKAWSFVQWVGRGSSSGIGCLSRADPSKGRRRVDISTIISDAVHLFNLLVPHWLQEIRCLRPADEKRRHLWCSRTGTAVASSRRRWEFGRLKADLLPNSG